MGEQDATTLYLSLYFAISPADPPRRRAGLTSEGWEGGVEAASGTSKLSAGELYWWTLSWAIRARHDIAGRDCYTAYETLGALGLS